MLLLGDVIGFACSFLQEFLILELSQKVVVPSIHLIYQLANPMKMYI